ncbi:hypothetical protein Tco_0031123 [Tanacetum coccineum]
MTAPGHLRKRVQKGKRCSEGWKKMCSTGSETRGRVHPCTQTTQGVGHTTVAAETLKVNIKVLVSWTTGQKSDIEDDLSQPWVCEETDPFTPRIRYFEVSQETRMPESYQTYDWNARTHKPPRFFQSATKRNDGNSNMVHMFNLHLLKPHSRLDDRVPKETIDSYDDLKKAFLENYL